MPQRLEGRVLRQGLTERLARAGFIAAPEEAVELLAAAGDDESRLEALVERRLTGEPLAWITGTTLFCGRALHVHPGVYVPRWQTEGLALRAAELLPAAGLAVDVCTGSGAIAAVMIGARPAATVFGTEFDETAAACAQANGVEVLRGDLLAAVDPRLAGAVDVITAVVPYVPTGELRLLQRDTLTFETPLAYDGGADGLDVARRVIAGAPRLLRPGGTLLLELGGTQDAELAVDLAAAGFVAVTRIVDDEGDPRGFEATTLGA